MTLFAANYQTNCIKYLIKHSLNFSSLQVFSSLKRFALKTLIVIKLNSFEKAQVLLAHNPPCILAPDNP
jgi:hypothetical protein